MLRAMGFGRGRFEARLVKMNSSGLYERAVDGQESAILHIGGGCTFWAGPNEYLASHQGAAPVYLAGLYGKFRLRIGDGAWRLCSGADIPPGVWHELDFGGEPFAALYLEPNFATGRALAPLLSGCEMIDGALVGRAGGVSLLRSLYEDRNGAEWAGLAINDLLRFSRRRAEPAQVDPRLSGVVEFLHQYCDDLTPVAELARCVGLSASRFQHLFSRQAGVPLRRYRAWSRLRAAWREIAKLERN